MSKTKFPLFKSLHSGQKGFTLIELLVVVAILGTIAAVVVLNVGGFMNRGECEAFQTELHQVQTAAVAGMTEDVVLPASVGPAGTGTLAPYMLGTLQYNWDIDGSSGEVTLAAGETNPCP